MKLQQQNSIRLFVKKHPSKGPQRQNRQISQFLTFLAITLAICLLLESLNSSE
uniref:Uncharacterized protein n=1 Tax=Schistosoma japonicum TaxID=6182 RepID=Q5C2Q3_SCHJA|nr:unknown [Schistosoma japonicum]